MTLFERVFNGNDAVYKLTEEKIKEAEARYGEEQTIGFPDTEYGLPCCYSVSGVKIKCLKDLKEAMQTVKAMMTRESRLGSAFASGIATALCAEFLEALKYIETVNPYEKPYYGHLGDGVIRELETPLKTGAISGIAVLIGAAPSAEKAEALIKSYQEQGILVTLVGEICKQAAEAGIHTGADVGIIPLGDEITSVIHAVSAALRIALMIGNIEPGNAEALMKYTMTSVPAFVNAFAPLDDIAVACGAGAIALGFPVITNETENIFRVPKSLIVQTDVDRFVQTSLEARDIII